MNILVFMPLSLRLNMFFCCIWYCSCCLVLLKCMTALGYAHSSAFEGLDSPAMDTAGSRPSV